MNKRYLFLTILLMIVFTGCSINDLPFLSKKEVVEEAPKIVEKEIENETEAKETIEEEMIVTEIVVEEEVVEEPVVVVEEKEVDSDNDGLLDKEELLYGTDINNPDTDGDGHNDGDEVRNGYNPMGEGKLLKKEVESDEKDYCAEESSKYVHRDGEKGEYSIKAFQCLCKSFKNNCSSRELIYDRGLLGPVKLSINKNGDNCEYRVDFGDESQIKIGSKKHYANKNILCSFDYTDVLEEIDSCEYDEINVGEYIDLPGNIMNMFFNDTEGCSGSLEKIIEIEDNMDVAERDSRRISDVKLIQTALELYYNGEIKYPNEVVSGGSIVSIDGEIIYLKEVPANLKPKNISVCSVDYGYTYEVKDNSKSYELNYCLEEGVGEIPAGPNIATPYGVFKK